MRKRLRRNRYSGGKGICLEADRLYPEFYDAPTPNLGVQAMGRIRYLDSYGESFDNGLQVKLDKRSNKGLTSGIAYTNGKAHGGGENGGQEGAWLQNPRDRRGSRGYFGFDQTHRLVGNRVHELPGRNLRGPAKYLTGGWQLNGIFSLPSGSAPSKTDLLVL